MVAVTTAFFALCLAYVRWCDHIIGPDPVDQETDPSDVAERAMVAEGAEAVDRTEVPA
jgi:hypothetical protein